MSQEFEKLALEEKDVVFLQVNIAVNREVVATKQEEEKKKPNAQWKIPKPRFRLLQNLKKMFGIKVRKSYIISQEIHIILYSVKLLISVIIFTSVGTVGHSILQQYFRHNGEIVQHLGRDKAGNIV